MPCLAIHAIADKTFSYSDNTVANLLYIIYYLDEQSLNMSCFNLGVVISVS